MISTDDGPASEEAWEREFTDVPMSSPEVGASVPSPEGMRTAENQSRRSRRSCYKFLGLGLLVFAIPLSLLIVWAVNAGGETDVNVGGETDDEPLSRVEEVITFLAQEGISNLTALQQSGTPQNIAATFMVEQDEADLALPTDDATAVDRYKYITRYVMAVLYVSMGGYIWDSQLGFTRSKDVCDWNARSTDGSIRKGVFCDDTSGLIYAILLGE
jgi:hypothetical protein